jgi:hypothetical protein
MRLPVAFGSAMLMIVAVIAAVATGPAVVPPRTVASSAPVDPPARICGDATVLSGPAAVPAGAVTVPAGDNSGFVSNANTTYWFAPGTHTLGSDQFGQIQPKDGDVFIGAPGAVLDGKGVNRYAFTAHAKNVTIKYLTIQGFVSAAQEGVVNHDSGQGWIVTNNTIQNNGGAGLFLATDTVAQDNCLKGNGQYGYSANPEQGQQYATDVKLIHNEIAGNNTVGDPANCGCTGAGKFWATHGADVTDNWIHDNHGVGIWPDTNNNDFLISGNYIENNDAEAIMYETSYNALISNNTIVRNALKQGPTNPGFPTGAIYLSESGGDARVTARYSSIEVTGNHFVDNWSGVVAWENADRFCGSPNNTSTGYCTLGNPTQANVQTCVSGTINNEPMYSDCRWKTQNVKVHDNQFDFNPANIGTNCTADTACGVQGLFSNYGTSPDWSPYKGTVIQDAVTFHNNNVWSNNTYTGPWVFSPYDQSKRLSPAAWQAAPYSQDAGSTFNGVATTTTTATSPPTTTSTTTPPPTTTSSSPPPTTTTTSTAPAVTIETADFEQDAENHIAWFTSKVTRSTASPISGTASLLAQATGANGSGVQLSNQPGYPGVEAGRAYDFSLKYREATATMPAVTWTIEWTKGTGTVIQSNTIVMPRSTATALAMGRFTAPVGATNVRWTFTWTTAKSGPAFRIDDLAVKSA